MPTDRDAIVDRLLRSRDIAQPDTAGVCPDPDLVAAWADGRLKGAELARCEAHIAACARCTALVAAFVRTEGTDVVPAPAAARSPWRWAIRWAMPLAAVAGAMVVWVVVNPGDRTSAPAVQSEVARLETPLPKEADDAGRPMAAQPAAGAAPTADAALKDAQPKEEQRRRADGRTRATGRDVPAATPLPATPAPAQAAPTEVASNETTAPAAPPAPARNAPAVEQEPVGQRAEKVAERQTGAFAPEPPSPASPAAAPPASAARDNAAAGAGPSALGGAVGGTLSRAKSVAGPLVLSAPDATLQCRVTDNVLQVSLDGGLHWEVTSVQPAARVLTGIVLAPAIAWIAGERGMVLVTDDGRRWRPSPLPESVDVVRITATSLFAAEVTTREGARYATLDGGRSWRKLAP